MLVTLTERRTSQPISAAAWESLADSDAFWRLVDRSIVAVTMRGREVRLTPGPWIGRARCGGVDLQIVEKVPGVLRALWSEAHLPDFRIERISAPSTELGDLLPLIIRSFLDETSAYLRRGREFTYERRREQGYLAAGRINFAGTALLQRNGFPGYFEFDRTRISRRTPKNQVLAAALRTIHGLATLVPIDRALIVRADTLNLYFADCLASANALDRRRMASAAEEMSERREHHRDRDVLSLASLLLREESFEPDSDLLGGSPVTWFLNLEVLFERAVRNAAARLVRGQFQVTAGAIWQRPVIGIPQFDPEPDATEPGIAKPDIVLELNGSFPAVGDAKYKEWTGRLARSDLYQLLVHTAAFASPVSFIVQPADEAVIVSMGMSAVGSHVTLVGVDPFDIAGGLDSYLRESGLLASI